MPTTTLPPCFNPPRLSAVPPVSIVHFRATVLHYGAHQGRHVYHVRDAYGRLVETISGVDDSTEQEVYSRWPWFATQHRDTFGLPHPQAHFLHAEVSPSEYRRLANIEPWAADATKLRRIGDRCAGFYHFCDAINDIRRNGNGLNQEGEIATATIYHRTRDLRQRLDQAEAAGIIVRVDDGAWSQDVRTISGQYRATEFTPYV